MAADDKQSNHKQGKPKASGAVSPSAKVPRPKERVPVKAELTEINQYLMCSLCSGYLIDATGFNECSDTFCKSCILKYLETNDYCPICDVKLNIGNPQLSLRSDVIVQRLVYKLVPGLLVSELKRRRECADGDKENPEAAESVSNGMAVEVESAKDSSTILSLEDVISLSIEYFRSTDVEKNNTDSKQRPALQQKQEQQLQSTPNAHNIQNVNAPVETAEANDRRYLKCPAAVSVGLLKKFIRMKYGLSDDYRVDLLYNGDRDNSLENDLTLLDIAFVYKWNKDEPMRFHYRIFDRTSKSLVARSGTKRSVSSMMDEPPDDDAASGPQNRPPMTSASPSSKIARLSNSSTSGANNNSRNTGGSYSRSTSTLSSSTPVYDFSEGNSDTEEPMQKGKLKMLGKMFHRRAASNSGISSNSDLGKSGSQDSKRSPSTLRSYSSRSQSYEGKVGRERSEAGSVRRRNSGTNTSSRGRSNSVGNPGDDITTEEGDSDSTDGAESDESKNTENSVNSLTNSRLRSAAQQVMQSQVNGSLKLSSASLIGEKREPLKLNIGSLAKSPERKHKHKHHKMKHKSKNKPLKISLNLNSSLKSHTPTTSNVNQSQSQNNHKSGKAPMEKASKHGQGQSRSVDGKGNGFSGSTNSQSNFPSNVKSATSAHLSNISKSISVSIGVNMSGNSAVNVATASHNQNLNSKGSQFGSKMSTNLLPKNKEIDIQPTTIPSTASNQTQQNSNSLSNCNQSTSRSHPLLPESVHVPKSVTLIPVNPNAMGSTGSSASGRSSGNVEKSGLSTSNRLNTHTFTHPITNKSLHQITVTEVPPPPKSGSSSPASMSGGSICSANNSGSNSNTNSGNVASNPIEKVIANAANKPQFNGPGSMEITKIYCGTKENPTKKLKERKGLDISITVPGLSVKEKPHKLEETLRQKIGMSNSGTMTINSKTKGGSQTPGPLFNAKMPPGITIGPAGANKNTSGITTNSNPSNASGNANTGNTVKGLGFALPPHITAHPQQPTTGIRNTVANQLKQAEKSVSNRVPHITNKEQSSLSVRKGKEGVGTGKPCSKTFNNNRKHLGEALASMIDMANRNAMKSPSPPKTCHQSPKDHKSLTPFSTQPTREPNSTNCEKRAIDMSSNRKNSRDSPEPKRSRANESINSKPSVNETPLDLSGRSSRPNSNSSSPIHQNLKPHSAMKSPNSEKTKNNEHSSKKSPTPIPKVSPPTAPSNFLSPSSAKSNSQRPSTNSGQTPTSSILSIAQSLAQKQLSQQQQQQQQNLHNQIMQLHQSMHAANQTASSHNAQGKPGSLGMGNSLSPKGSNTPSIGLNSLSPPIISMPNPSPPGPGFDPLRNLLTLSDVAVRHGKVHPMNNLMAAVGLCPPPSHAHPGLSMPSPSSVTSGSLFSHLSPHLVNSLGGKSPTGILDPNTHAHLFGNLAAISAAHHERLAAAAGLSHFGGSLSPPLSLANSFYSQVRPPSTNPLGSLRIPSVTPKSSSSNNNKKGPSTPPLSFSHPPTVSASHSPNTTNTLSKASPPISISSSTGSVSSNSISTHSKSTDSSNFNKNTKVNGSLYSNHLPILPPGIHNPLLPIYSRSPTTNSVSGALTSTSTKVTYSDKKGIPNSMKISNFLPNKPKDGKGTDSSNVEATITSGSNVGGTSLTKFLNSIPPLTVAQAQPNLSVSSSTPLKESSRVLNTVNNKSSNEQECLPVSTSSKMQHSSDALSRHLETSTSSSDPIKNESTLNKPIIASPHLTCNTNLVSTQATKTSPTSTVKVGDGVKSEIESEEQSGAKKVGSLGLCSIGMGSPPSVSLGRSTQPQNQAVRHIPNPAMLFNRQNNSNQIGSVVPTTSNSNTSVGVKLEGASNKTLPFNQKSPLKLDEYSMQVPALPCPGVSVPVQVKVDNDALPIPIPVLSLPNTNKQEQCHSDETIPKPVTIADMKVNFSNAMPNVDSSTKVDEEFPTLGEEGNQICKAEEIVKIEYTEDADLDIDVGIEESSPIFPSIEDDGKREDKSSASTAEVEINDEIQNDEPSQQIGNIQNETLACSVNEMIMENTSNLNEVEDNKAQPDEDNDSESSSDTKHAEEVECGSTLSNVPALVDIEASDSEPKCVESMEIDTMSKVAAPTEEQSETAVTVAVESKEELDGESNSSEQKVAVEVEAEIDEPMPMEVQSVQVDPEVREDEKVQQDVVVPNPVQSSGEIPEVEMQDVPSTLNPIEAESVDSEDKSAELQITTSAEMECEEVADPELTEQGQDNSDSVRVLSMDTEEGVEDQEVKEVVLAEYLEIKEMSESKCDDNQITLPSQDLPSQMDIATTESILSSEDIAPVPASGEEETFFAEANVDVAIFDTTPDENKATEIDSPDSPPYEQIMDMDFLMNSEGLKLVSNTDSNPIPNQISINPEALQVVDRNEESTDMEIGEAANEPAVIKESSESVNPLNNAGDDVPEKLMDSSSASQLERNCLSDIQDTNDIEFSNSLLTPEAVVHPDNSSIDHVVDQAESCETEDAEAIELDLEEPTIPSTTSNMSLVANDATEVEENCQNITNAVLELVSMSSIVTDEKPVEAPTENSGTEVDPPALFLSPDTNPGISPVTRMEQLISGPKLVLVTMGDPEEEKVTEDFQSFQTQTPALISATATITTTTSSEMSTSVTKMVEIEVGITGNTLPSPISSINSLESPTSPDDNMKKMESLEKVLFASAATSINNNNNTSLTINAPTCDISITTSNASDMTTV